MKIARTMSSRFRMRTVFAKKTATILGRWQCNTPETSRDFASLIECTYLLSDSGRDRTQSGRNGTEEGANPWNRFRVMIAVQHELLSSSNCGQFYETVRSVRGFVPAIQIGVKAQS